MTDLEKYKLGLSARLIAWRWWFIIIAIFIISLLERLFPNLFGLTLPLPGIYLIIFFLGLAVFNLLVWLGLKLPKINQSSTGLLLIAWVNVLGDILALTFLLYLLNGDLVLLAPFYLWPIVSAIILFNFPIAILIASLIGLILISFSYALYFDQINFLFDSGVSLSEQSNLSLSLIWAGLYLALTSVLAYQYRLIKSLNIFTWQVDSLPKSEKADWKFKASDEIWQKKLNQAQREIAAKNLEIKMMDKQLAELDQAKSKFVSVTTHQMRTPLSAIKWTLSMMISKHLGEINSEQEEFLQKGLDATQRLITIVNNLMHVGDIKTDTADFNWLEIDLIKLIEQVIAEFDNQISGKKINFKFIKPKRDLPNISADADKLKIVLENLLDNAIKYSPAEGRVTIKVLDDRMNTAQRGVEIVISDSGIGIPLAEQKKIFHKFFRASNAVNLEPDGSGVGLYICKDIIEKHGGTLWFESVDGEGTTFHLTLPLKLKK